MHEKVFCAFLDSECYVEYHTRKLFVIYAGESLSFIRIKYERCIALFCKTLAHDEHLKIALLITPERHVFLNYISFKCSQYKSSTR